LNKQGSAIAWNVFEQYVPSDVRHRLQGKGFKLGYTRYGYGNRKEFKMIKYKQLICGLGCRGNKAYDLRLGEAAGTDIQKLCRHTSDNGADQLFILDQAETEKEHEETILTLKEIAGNIDVPIITGGWIRRLEDVKKYLYAGALAVFLDVRLEEHVDLIKEASSRFGSEKIYAYLPDGKYLARAEEYMQLGASSLILKSTLGEQLSALSADPANADLLKIPMVIFSDAASLPGRMEETADALSKRCSLPGIQGVIVPDTGDVQWMALKQSLKAKGFPMDTFETSIAWAEFKLNSDGLIPVIVQDYQTDEVLMLAYMNEEAFKKTLETGKMTYYSRSRKTLWLKGETSGHFQYVKSLALDCDNDTILAKVHQLGAACHTGSRSCFFKTLAAKEYRETNPLKVFEEEYKVIRDRKEHPKEGSYTNYLFDKGIDKILKKCGEEATEIIIAAKNPEPEEIKYEIADFLYHVMVLMVEKGVTWEEITKEIANR